MEDDRGRQSRKNLSKEDEVDSPRGHEDHALQEEKRFLRVSTHTTTRNTSRTKSTGIFCKLYQLPNWGEHTAPPGVSAVCVRSLF